MSSHCCVKSCSFRGSHRFPDPIKNKVKYTEWYRSVFKGNPDNPTKKFRICGRHFEDKYKYSPGNGINFLFQNAVPSLFLDAGDDLDPCPAAIKPLEAQNVQNTVDSIHHEDHTYEDNNNGKEKGDLPPKKINLDQSNVKKGKINKIDRNQHKLYVKHSNKDNNNGKMGHSTPNKILLSQSNANKDQIHQIDDILHEFQVIQAYEDANNGKEKKNSIPIKLSQNFSIKDNRNSASSSYIQTLQRKNNSLQKQCSYYKKKHMLNKAKGPHFYLDKIKGMSPTIKAFIKSQLDNSSKKVRGCRYSSMDKVSALSIMKQSGSAYKFLRRIFLLPSRTTLEKFLHGIPISEGLNSVIFDHLKVTVGSMKDGDRNCILLFSVIDLNLENAENGSNTGDNVSGTDQILMFIVRGLNMSWNQPIAYYCVNSSSNIFAIVNSVKEVISQLLDCGLKVVGTVCESDSSNNAAISILEGESETKCFLEGKQYTKGSFCVNNAEIFPIFDATSLIILTRNDMIQNSLNMQIKGKLCTAEWAHILAAYHKDLEAPTGFRCLYKIGESHVVPEKINMMKFSHSVEVLSAKMAGTMNLMVRGSMLEPAAEGTALIINFLDNLIDSVNGDRLSKEQFKELRNPLTAKSPHIAFWKEAIESIKTMQFIDIYGNTIYSPTIANWIKTIEAIQKIFLKVKKEVPRLILRNFNRDPLESVFSGLKATGVKNAKPTYTQFTNSFKTLLRNAIVNAKTIEKKFDDGNNSALNENLTRLVEMSENNIQSRSEVEGNTAAEILENNIQSTADVGRNSQADNNSMLSQNLKMKTSENNIYCYYE